jgi:hypothetical protein
MKKYPVFFFWVIVVVLQVVLQAWLLWQKIQDEEFYLWNLVALVAALVFIFYRLSKKKILVNAEMLIALFIGVNGIVTIIGEFITPTDLPVLIAGIAITLLSFAVMFTLGKSNNQ